MNTKAEETLEELEGLLKDAEFGKTRMFLTGSGQFVDQHMNAVNHLQVLWEREKFVETVSRALCFVRVLKTVDRLGSAPDGQ